MELQLVFREANVEKTRRTLGAGEYVIGRDRACEIVVGSDAVSRRHARLTIEENQVYLEDLGSANGTYVENHRAEGRVRLKPGASVLLGHVVMQAQWRAPLATEIAEAEAATPQTVE